MRKPAHEIVMKWLESEIKGLIRGDYKLDPGQFLAKQFILVNLLREMVIPEDQISNIIGKLREISASSTIPTVKVMEALADEIAKEFGIK